MGALPELITIGVHFSCVVIDMALVLVFFRIVGQWRSTGWIASINCAAEDVVDRLTAAISLRWQLIVGIRLSQRGVLAASVATLCLARLLLEELAGLLT